MEKQQNRRRQRRIRIRRQSMLQVGILLCLLLSVILLLSYCKEAKAASSDPTDSVSGNPLPDDGPGRITLPAELPAGYIQANPAEQELAIGTLTLVNRAYSFDPVLSKTVSVYENKTDSYLVKDTELRIDPEALDALNRWLDAFAAVSGKTDVNVVAGWRSYDDQALLYQNAVVTKGQAHADAYLALPGHSEHHTGLAVDFSLYDVEAGTSADFDGSGAYQWVVEHAWEYGFVQRYPPEKSDVTGIDYESWHYRYVGLPHAYVMATEDLCLEEYISYLRAYPFFGEHLSVTCLGKTYEIYFCPKDQVIVPTTGSYTISGNNTDGFVITVSGLSS